MDSRALYALTARVLPPGRKLEESASLSGLYEKYRVDDPPKPPIQKKTQINCYITDSIERTLNTTNTNRYRLPWTCNDSSTREIGRGTRNGTAETGRQHSRRKNENRLAFRSPTVNTVVFPPRARFPESGGSLPIVQSRVSYMLSRRGCRTRRIGELVSPLAQSEGPQ